jgi:hypothetical protein
MLQNITQFLNTNRGDILVSFIGAFFGFAFALILEWVLTFIRDNNRKKKLLKAIISQLRKLKDGDKDAGTIGLDAKLQSDDPYFRYEYFVWETAKSSGELMLISKEKYFEQLLKIYSDIYFADLLEQKYFDLYISSLTSDSEELKKQKNALNKARKGERQKIVKEIQSFVNLKLDGNTFYRLSRFIKRS